MFVLAGAFLMMAVVAVIAITLLSGQGSKAPLKANVAVTTVNKLLAGIPQSGNTLGYASAPVTVTEYGDLVCPVCQSFATTSESQLISTEVRAGKVKIVYRGLETASFTANNAMYSTTQTAVRSAGLQDKAWNYIELFYNQQGDETTPYVTTTFLQHIASEITGLNLIKWQANLTNPTLVADVTADGKAAAAAGAKGTPYIIISGSKGQVVSPVAVPTLASMQQAIAQVS